MSDLTDAEREALACVATGHEPDLCDCNDGYREVADRFCGYAQEAFAVVARIKADAEARGYERGAAERDVLQEQFDRQKRTIARLLDVEAERDDLRAQLAAVEAVHACYFDMDGKPGRDDTNPEPEDVWRYDRDLRAALATPTGGDA